MIRCENTCKFWTCLHPGARYSFAFIYYSLIICLNFIIKKLIFKDPIVFWSFPTRTHLKGTKTRCRNNWLRYIQIGRYFSVSLCFNMNVFVVYKFNFDYSVTKCLRLKSSVCILSAILWENNGSIWHSWVSKIFIVYP
jgi:hypothetical protein